MPEWIVCVELHGPWAFHVGKAVVTGSSGEVFDVARVAFTRGVRPGMTARQLYLVAPDLPVGRWDPARAAALRRDLLGVFGAFTPRAELDDGRRRAFLWMPAPEVPRRELGALVAELGRRGAWRVLWGAGPNRLLARAALQVPGRVVEGAGAGAALASLPVGWLEPDFPGMARRLERLGVLTLGQLLALPPGEVRRRLGPEADRLGHLLSGGPDGPLAPVEERRIRWVRRLEPPVVEISALLEEAARNLEAECERERVAFGWVGLALRDASGRLARAERRLGPPRRGHAARTLLFGLARRALEGSRLEGISGIWASVGELSALRWEQVSLVGEGGHGRSTKASDEGRRRGGVQGKRAQEDGFPVGKREELEGLLERLALRFGGRAVRRGFPERPSYADVATALHDPWRRG